MLFFARSVSAAALFMESGTDATQGFEFYTFTNGTVATDTGTVNTGPRSIKMSGTGARLTVVNTLTGDAGRLSYYVNAATLGSTSIVGLSFVETATGFFFFNLCRTSAGVLQLRADSSSADCTGTQLGSNGSTIGASWARITMTWNITNATTFTIKVFVNGVADITATSGTLNAANLNQFWIGTASTATSAVTYYDDIYVDDVSDNTDTGDIHVTAKLPASLNTNNFDTEIGSSANRYDDVNQRPLSEAKGWQQAATADVQENYGLTTAANGDVDVSAATLVARSAWVWAKRGNQSIRQVQSFSNSSKTAGTTLAVTVSSPTANNTYLIAFAMDSAAGTISATDNATVPNTYTVDKDLNPGGSATTVRMAIIRANLVTVTSLTTVTITLPSVTAKAAVVVEFAGPDLITPLDVTNSNSATSGTAATSNATGTTAQADEVIFGAIGREDDRTNTPFARTGTGMTPDQTFINSGATAVGTTGGGAASNISVEALWAIQTATSTQTADDTVTSGDWTALVATYKASPSGGSSLGTPKIMDNGSETAITLGTASALYSVVTTSASYPSNAAGIGMRSSNATPDTFFYEGGTLIAYIPAAAPVTCPRTLTTLGVGC